MRQKIKNHRKQGSFDKKFDFFSPDPKSHTQVGSLCAKNASEKFSRLGTFKVMPMMMMTVVMTMKKMMMVSMMIKMTQMMIIISIMSVMTMMTMVTIIITISE
jgi:hypothetical protein